MPRPVQRGVWTEIDKGRYPSLDLYLDEKKIASWGYENLPKFLEEFTKDANELIKIVKDRRAAYRDDDRY